MTAGVCRTPRQPRLTPELSLHKTLQVLKTSHGGGAAGRRSRLEESEEGSHCDWLLHSSENIISESLAEAPPSTLKTLKAVALAGKVAFDGHHSFRLLLMLLLGCFQSSGSRSLKTISGRRVSNVFFFFFNIPLPVSPRLPNLLNYHPTPSEIRYDLYICARAAL